jgi:catechol-2,3-dioxygenase
MRGADDMIGRVAGVVLDTADPRSLAQFYASMLGLDVKDSDESWVDIGPAGSDDVTLSFQHAPNHQPPQWPDPAYPQQFHLDITIDGDIENAEKEVLALGASKLGSDNETFRVYADPSGHPFCLCWG